MIAHGIPLSPADSAYAVTQLYTISLAATVPLAAAALAAVAVRHQPAGMRHMVWRCAIVGLLVVYAGHMLPAHWVAWILPGALASPLVALGRSEVTGNVANLSTWLEAPRVLLLVYWAGVLAVAWPIARGWTWARRVCTRSRVFARAQVAADDVGRIMGLRRSVRIVVNDDVRVPMTCGTLRPVVVLPSGAEDWDAARLRAVLLHELSHIASGDVAFAMAARAMAALYWFHPAAWFIDRRLHDACEQSCDDRVLDAGVPASDYAALLAQSADENWTHVMAAAGMNGHGRLRTRLAAIVDTRRDLRAPRRSTVAFAMMLTLAIAAPASVVQLAPTRGVLTALMDDARWDTRAYAVLRLAQRPDSIAVARAAAVSDPSPRVRAWARYAVGRVHVAPAASTSISR